jgi:hypothetical protein
MRSSLLLAPLLAAPLLALPAAAVPQGGAGIFREGAPLPHLELPTIDGARAIDLASLRGKRTLLIQFASW